MAIGARVVQVTNIAPQATKDQMQTLFGYLGKIEDIRLYPTIRDVSCPVQSRICYIKFVDPTTVGIAQHMTNTVFIDRALIVIPISSGDIPDEYFALEMTRNGTIVPGLCPSEPNLPANVVNQLTTVAGGAQVIVTMDPKLDARGLPQYPALPANYDSRKIEEIRRTVLLVNVEPTVNSDDVIEFFSGSGEVKYLRQCSRQSDNSVHMLVEFSDQPSVVEALELNGKELKGRAAQIIHSLQAIVKPQAKSNEAAQREIEEAMSRVKEAQNLISATIDPVIGMLSKEKRSSRRSRSRSRGRRRRSRSRSRSRRRSRSRHRSRRTRSRSRRRSRSRDRKRRSKSRSKRRSHSRPRRSKSRGRSHRSRSKSKSRTSRGNERHKSKERERARTPRDRDRSRERDRKSKERERSPREKDRPRTPPEPREKEKRIDKETTPEPAPPVEEKRVSKKRGASRSPSHKRSRERDRSRDRKRSRSRDRKRSKSRGNRRRSPSPRSGRRKSRSRSKEGRKERREKKEKRERTPPSPMAPKPSRNYDDEDRGYDMDTSKKDDKIDYYEEEGEGKESPEKSDNMDISNSP